MMAIMRYPMCDKVQESFITKLRVRSPLLSTMRNAKNERNEFAVKDPSKTVNEG